MMVKEEYHKPKIHSEEIEIGVYGDYHGGMTQIDPPT